MCSILLGFGIFMTQHISAGDIVLEYAGQLLPVTESDKQQNQTYIYYFELGSVTYRQAVSVVFFCLGILCQLLAHQLCWQSKYCFANVSLHVHLSAQSLKNYWSEIDVT